jgi:hypothetical protein
VVGTVGTVAVVPGTVRGGAVVDTTTGTSGAVVVVVCNAALSADCVPLGQPIAATIANRAVVDTPATRTFEV